MGDSAQPSSRNPPGTTTCGDLVSGQQSGDIERLRRLLGGPDTSWLLQRLHSRLEARGDLRGSVTKPKATMAERAAASRMVGRPVRAGQSASVSLDLLDETLRRSGAWPEGLESAVVALTGEVIGPEVRRAEREGWQRAAEVLRELAADRPELAQWATDAVRAGMLKRAAPNAAAACTLATQLADIAAALPVDGESLGVFSAQVLGDAHALDARSSLGSAASGLAARLGQLESEAAQGSARWRREAWQLVGVVVDELSSMVLTLGLPGGDASSTARALREFAASGQPAIVTLRQLMADDVGAIPPLVSVCENPAVVSAAADRFGPQSAPLVCLNGQPGAAALHLLKSLVAGGARVRYHGDFDAGGMAIARSLAGQIPWQPWRFAARDYEDACATFTGLTRFSGSPGRTDWDPPLAETMASAGVRVEEELVLDGLLADLG